MTRFYPRLVLVGVLEIAAFGCNSKPPEDLAQQSRAGGEQNSTGSDAAFSLPTPTRTRAGTLRFASQGVENPRMVSMILERLDDTTRASEEREALVEALPRTGGDWQGAVLERYPGEEDARVRQMMVAIMRRAEEPAASRGVLLGFQDPEAAVRAEAASTASFLNRGAPPDAPMRAALMHALADGDDMVRAGAARSLGALRVEESFSALAALLEDASPEVRLHALGAVGRLDAARARGLAAVQALVSDGDTRVARAARALVE